MSYSTLQEVLDSDDALDDGIKFFLDHPKEFINLIKKNHKLALVFAKTFTTEHIEAMVKSCYGFINHEKFFTMLITMNTREIALKDTVTEQEMLQYFLNKHLLYLDTTEGNCKYRPLFNEHGQPLKYVFFFNDPDNNYPILWGQQIQNIAAAPHAAGAELENKYRALTNDQQMIKCLFTIVATMIEKVTGAKLLDGEFKDEAGFFDAAKTNSVFHTLMKWPSEPMSTILAVLLQNTSPEIAERELAANKGDCFKEIINNLPVTKSAYDAAYAIFLTVANRGKAELDSYIHKFNFGILRLLEQKQSTKFPNLATQFYELGTIAPSKKPNQANPLEKRFQSSSHRYSSSNLEIQKPVPSPNMSIPETNNNNNNNNNSNSPTSFLSGYKSSSFSALQRRPSHPPPAAPNLSTSLPNTSATNTPPPPYYFPEQAKLKELEEMVRRQSDEHKELEDKIRRQSDELDELKKDLGELKEQTKSKSRQTTSNEAFFAQ